MTKVEGTIDDMGVKSDQLVNPGKESANVGTLCPMCNDFRPGEIIHEKMMCDECLDVMKQVLVDKRAEIAKSGCQHEWKEMPGSITAKTKKCENCGKIEVVD